MQGLLFPIPWWCSRAHGAPWEGSQPSTKCSTTSGIMSPENSSAGPLFLLDWFLSRSYVGGAGSQHPEPVRLLLLTLSSSQDRPTKKNPSLFFLLRLYLFSTFRCSKAQTPQATFHVRWDPAVVWSHVIKRMHVSCHWMEGGRILGGGRGTLGWLWNQTLQTHSFCLRREATPVTGPDQCFCLYLTCGKTKERKPHIFLSKDFDF